MRAPHALDEKTYITLASQATNPHPPKYLVSFLLMPTPLSTLLSTLLIIIILYPQNYNLSKIIKKKLIELFHKGHQT